MAKKTFNASALDSEIEMPEHLQAWSASPTPKRPAPPPDNALIPHTDGSIQLGGVKLTTIGLQFSSDLDGKQFDALSQFVIRFEQARPWLIGDYIAYGDRVGYGDVTLLASKFGKDAKTASNYASVCRSVEYSRRREDLTFGHHEVVAGFSPDEQVHYLALAAEGDGTKRWSVKQLREYLHGRAGEPYNRTLRKKTKAIRDILEHRLTQIGASDNQTIAQMLITMGQELLQYGELE